MRWCIERGKEQFLQERLVVFDDQVYYPNVLPGVPVRQYRHILVDEAQDTSRAVLELILKACGAQSQVFFIGDPLQSIYLFAGANYDSIEQIRRRLQAETLPLLICYRCGSRIVALANRLGGSLISAGTHKGEISVIAPTDYLERLQPGHAVLGRPSSQAAQTPILWAS